MKTKADLLAEVAWSRSAIARDTVAVRTRFDLAAQVRESVRFRPFAWIGGAAAIGYILAGPKTRTKTVTKFVRDKSKDQVAKGKKKPKTSLGVAFSLLKVSLPVVRPLLSAYATRRLAEFAGKLAK